MNHSPRLGSRKEVLRLAWPIAISMMSFTIKGFVDTLMVGQLGTDVLGAVGLASVATWMAMTFPWGILRGQRPLISQYLGAGKPEVAFSFGIHAFYLALLCGVGLVVLADPLTELFKIYAGSTAIGDTGANIASGYFKIRMQWLLPTLLTFAVAEYLRSIGETRVPMMVDIFVHPLNIFFNWVLIFGHLGFEPMGANGAALGTGIADVCALAAIFILVKPKNRLTLSILKVRTARMIEVLKVGFTGAVQFSLEAVSFITITWFIGKTGATALAVHQVGIQLVHISMLGGAAIADGGSVLIGNYVGDNNYKAVRKTLRSTLEIITPYMLFVGACFIIFRHQLGDLFLNNDDPAEYAKAMQLNSGVLIAAAIWQLGDVLQIAFRFALRAAGDHVWVMWAGILCTWLLSMPVAWLVVFVFKGDVADVWMAWNVEIFIGSAFFVQRWRSGKWVKKRLVKDGDS
jgi:MATE family multidrug resistance protein